jgi:hypothetical protein
MRAARVAAWDASAYGRDDHDPQEVTNPLLYQARQSPCRRWVDGTASWLHEMFQA